MNYMPLRARSIRGEVIEFSIQDCPRLYTPELFYLSNKRGTPLLIPTTLMFGSDMFYETGKRVFEGDVVRSKNTGKVYVVEYYTDFYLLSLTNERIDIFDILDYDYAGMYYDYEVASNVQRKQNPTRIARYKVDRNEDAKFSLFQILFTRDEDMSFSYQPLGESSALYSSVHQKLKSKGLFGEFLYLGESKYNLFTITMKNGRIYYSTSSDLIHHSEKEKISNLVKSV